MAFDWDGETREDDEEIDERMIAGGVEEEVAPAYPFPILPPAPEVVVGQDGWAQMKCPMCSRMLIKRVHHGEMECSGCHCYVWK